MTIGCHAYRGNAEPLRGPGPHLVLFVAAHVGDSSPLMLAEEAAAIQRDLDHARNHSEVRIEACWATNLIELRRQLATRKPTIVHFAGHGNPGLVLRNEYDQPWRVSARALATTIATSPRTRMVVFSACHSARHAEAVRTAVDCVVGTRGNVGDDGAHAFAAGLYSALARRQPVAGAVKQAVAAVNARQGSEFHLPIWWSDDAPIALAR
jgi:CHAT domain-containing protein